MVVAVVATMGLLIVVVLVVVVVAAAAAAVSETLTRAHISLCRARNTLRDHTVQTLARV